MSNFKIDYANVKQAHRLREKINMNGIRNDFIADMFNLEKSCLSMYLCGKRVMPYEIEQKLTEYVKEIELVNRKYE